MTEFWKDPEARIFQFLGQDNVYFYVLMQGALWLGTQDDPQRQPQSGDYQFTDIFGSSLLMVAGDKMSKSLGNSVTGDELLDEKGYSPDQIRYYLALMSLPEKPANFDFDALDERNRFLAGPINSAFERPISACHSKFDGKVPEGVLSGEGRDGNRSNDPALSALDGARRIRDSAERDRELRTDHQQPVHSVQAS